MRNMVNTEGVSSRIKIETDGNEFYLKKLRKSRIIVADATKIIDIDTHIYKQHGKHIILETNAPICSKSITLFNENNIKIVIVE